MVEKNISMVLQLNIMRSYSLWQLAVMILFVDAVGNEGETALEV